MKTQFPRPMSLSRGGVSAERRQLAADNRLASVARPPLRRIAVLFALCAFFCSQANAQTVPPLINYQGYLTTASNTPLPTADYVLAFSIWDAGAAGTRIWGPQIFDGAVGTTGHRGKVPVVQGYFNLMLGPEDTTGASIMGAFNASSRFVEIKVGDNNAIAPRQQILSAPFALKAANSDKLAGYDWGSLLSINDPVNGKLSGAKIATDTITSGQIANDAVGAGEMQNSAVSTAKIQDGAVVTTKLGDGVVTGQKLADGAVQTTKIADAQITTAKLQDGVITTTKLSDGAVVEAKLASGSVSTRTIQGSAVNSGAIADGAVGSSKIANGSIGLNHLAAVVTNTLSPPGTVAAFAGATAPDGWLLCDGLEVSRSQYASLYAAISTAWGTGDGINTFNKPDLRGVFLRGVNGSRSGPFADPGDNRTGTGIGSFQPDAFQGHWHDLWGDNDTGGSLNGGFRPTRAEGSEIDRIPNVRHVRSPITDGQNGVPRTATETRPKNAYVNYIIKF